VDHPYVSTGNCCRAQDSQSLGVVAYDDCRWFAHAASAKIGEQSEEYGSVMELLFERSDNRLARIDLLSRPDSKRNALAGNE